MAKCINCGCELSGVNTSLPLWNGTDEKLCRQCSEKFDKIRGKIYTTGVYDRSGFLRKYEDYLKSNGFTENGIDYIADYYTSLINGGSVEKGGAVKSGAPLFDAYSRSNKEEEVYTVEPQYSGETSTASTFCKVLGILTWLGGLIIAFNSAQVSGLVGFLSPCILYGIAGGMMFCVSELLQNVKSIADSLKGMRVIEKRKEDDTSKPN